MKGRVELAKSNMEEHRQGGQALLASRDTGLQLFMTLRFSARSVVLLLGVLWSFTGSAQTIGEIGTLVFLDIPEDAVVRVDGEIVQLEVDARRGQFLPYPAGRGIPVHVTTPDGARVSVVAGVDVGSITTIQFRDSEFRPPRAALALFAPGIPQLSFGRPVVGGLVLAGLAGAVGGTVWAGQRGAF